MSDAPGLDDLKALVESSLKEARRRGASAADAGVTVDSGLSVTVRLGEIETLVTDLERLAGEPEDHVNHRPALLLHRRSVERGVSVDDAIEALRRLPGI